MAIRRARRTWKLTGGRYSSANLRRLGKASNAPVDDPILYRSDYEVATGDEITIEHLW